MPQPSVVPPLLNSSATAANRFFERRSSRTTRTCGSPNTPRTLAAARKPGSEYPSDRRRRRCFDLAILQHAKIERIPNLKKALIHKLICRYNPLKSPTRLPEDPEKVTLEGSPFHPQPRWQRESVKDRDKAWLNCWAFKGVGITPNETMQANHHPSAARRPPPALAS